MSSRSSGVRANCSMSRARSSGRSMNSSISSRRKSFATSASSAMATSVPLHHRVADREQVLERRLQRDRALRADHLDAGGEVLAYLLADLRGALRVERARVVDVADQADAPVDGGE